MHHAFEAELQPDSVPACQWFPNVQYILFLHANGSQMCNIFCSCMPMVPKCEIYFYSNFREKVIDHYIHIFNTITF